MATLHFPARNGGNLIPVPFYIWYGAVRSRNHSGLIQAMWNPGTDTVLINEYGRQGWLIDYFGLDLAEQQENLSLVKARELIKHMSWITRLPIRQTGGDTRSEEIKQMWADDEVLKTFARNVDELHLMWKVIKTFVYKCGSKEAENEWLTQMSERDEIKPYLARYPKLTTKDVLRRAVDSSLSQTDREPRQLTYFHAALETEVEINGERLNIVEAYAKYEDRKLSPMSLDRYYKKAKSLAIASVQA